MRCLRCDALDLRLEVDLVEISATGLVGIAYAIKLRLVAVLNGGGNDISLSIDYKIREDRCLSFYGVVPCNGVVTIFD